MNPLTGTDNNGDTYSSDRPAGIGRNSFHTVMQTQIHASISRRSRIAGRFIVEARAEVFNAINRNNLIEVNNVYGEGPEPRPAFRQPIAGVARTRELPTYGHSFCF
ncbi:MAG TPA: hypothetical protein VM120_03195 [Bryobacteraceae bacterium]|nr:hypothetical protein [Bryobacteraceae bacterium]